MKNDIEKVKKNLRRELREKRKALALTYKAEASRAITDRVISSPAYKKAETVFVYSSIEDEVDTRALIDQAFKDGKRVCLPLCLGDHTMAAVEVGSLSDLVPGYLGILEPKAELAVDHTVAEPDLTVIPCLSASPTGARIGYGGGFYDEFLNSRSTIKMCLCFGEQVMTGLPREDHDVLMDLVVTENEVFRKEK